MSTQTVRAVLEHQVAVGDAVALEGWVRSRRTSKGGFSFLHVNDGSSLDSVQVVADGALDNYESEIVELGTGCSVRVEMYRIRETITSRMGPRSSPSRWISSMITRPTLRT